MLCRKYGLDPLRDIVDHREGYQEDMASSHADVSHWFPRHGKSMDTLRADVKALLEGERELTQEQFDAMFQTAMAAYRKEQEARPVSSWAETDGTRR